jgi:hypothetical protein
VTYTGAIDHAQHDAAERGELCSLARRAVDQVPQWRAAGGREEALTMVLFHAGLLVDDNDIAHVAASRCRAHAFALAALLGLNGAPEAGHLATDLFDLLDVWR